MKQSLNFLGVLKAVPLMPRVNALFRTFVERSAVVLSRKAAILSYITRVINLQKKLMAVLGVRRAKRRALSECLCNFIEWQKLKEAEADKKKKKAPVKRIQWHLLSP